ncbi:MAG: hypothetical protein JXA93_21365 [Anaerolineae bacterium]|nr:hypothetical protein [Anaerolineae bacterium]
MHGGAVGAVAAFRTAHGPVVMQGLAEGDVFGRDALDDRLDLAWYGIEHLLVVQQAALNEGEV